MGTRDFPAPAAHYRVPLRVLLYGGSIVFRVWGGSYKWGHK